MALAWRRASSTRTGEAPTPSGLSKRSSCKRATAPDSSRASTVSIVPARHQARTARRGASALASSASGANTGAVVVSIACAAAVDVAVVTPSRRIACATACATSPSIRARSSATSGDRVESSPSAASWRAVAVSFTTIGRSIVTVSPSGIASCGSFAASSCGIARVAALIRSSGVAPHAHPLLRMRSSQRWTTMSVMRQLGGRRASQVLVR